jgi:nicotinate-nucleotide pyrophosphorylase (carboxylating)
MELNPYLLQPIIDRALEEDIGTGDVTTELLVPADVKCRAEFIAKEGGVVAGLDVARLTFESLDDEVWWEDAAQDGEWVEPGTTLAEVGGHARAILTGERVALNFLRHLSGVATMTHRFVQAVQPHRAKIVDTRKTTPGLRLLEKYAVRMGGGHNHRFGLYDAMLIKDNHVELAGGVRVAIERARSGLPFTMKVEVEVKNLDELREALGAQPDIILLDNMTPDEMTEAVKIVNGRVLLEASGGINETNVVAVAATGVDVISVGALTHSVKALDISLKVVEVFTL